MKSSLKGWLLFLVVLAPALALRLPRLEQRPLHGDEAVHAVKFGKLLEDGFYRYDRREYHGPTLNYFTLIAARLGSVKTFPELSEFTLRIVPVFFGILLILQLLLLRGGLSGPAVVMAAVLTAISPAMVFYSRYYIQEMLLVSFTLGVISCGYRYRQTKSLKWAVLVGVFLGLAHATKETCIIAFGAMLMALIAALIMQGKGRASFLSFFKAIFPGHIVVALMVAFIVSALFYSSFLNNIGGIADSFASYKVYFSRAEQNDWHLHRWYYYLKMLIYWRYEQGPIWSEALIVILAGIGLWAIFSQKGIKQANVDLLRFLAFYTVIMTVIYSVIPYKTPWSMLGFLQGMILLAAVGGAALLEILCGTRRRVFIGLLLTAGVVHLGWQGYRGNFRYFADTHNPYVYAHTSMDVYDITRHVEEIARIHPQGYKVPIQVICSESDYWPLPWYLRAFSQVGWWSSLDENFEPGPVIIASAGLEPSLINKLYEEQTPGEKNLYVPLFDGYMELRPQVELRGYITKDLWDKLQQYRQSSPDLPTDINE